MVKTFNIHTFPGQLCFPGKERFRDVFPAGQAPLTISSFRAYALTHGALEALGDLDWLAYRVSGDRNLETAHGRTYQKIERQYYAMLDADWKGAPGEALAKRYLRFLNRYWGQ